MGGAGAVTSPSPISDAATEFAASELVAEALDLEAGQRRDLQAVVELALQIADVPTGVVNILTEREQHQVAAVGLEPSVCAREDSMCAVTVAAQQPIIVRDASIDARFHRNPFVTGEIAEVRFYAAHPLRTRDGHVIGTLCVFDDQPRELDPVRAGALEALAGRVVDILELSARTRELERSVRDLMSAQAELRRSNSRLGQFAGQVSHDLLNPLSAIAMSLEILEDAGVPEDDGAWALGKARSGVARMERMITGLLEYARLGADVSRSEVALDGVVAEVREDLSTVLADATVEVDPLPTVVGSEVQLRAVFQNLLSNAAKFTRPVRTPHLRVRGVLEDHVVRVEISDNGPGIPPDRREAVFDLLVRNTADVEGSGIGLATCRAIVNAHGGTISLHDGPDGVGTTVRIELPQS